MDRELFHHQMLTLVTLEDIGFSKRIQDNHYNLKGGHIKIKMIQMPLQDAICKLSIKEKIDY